MQYEEFTGELDKPAELKEFTGKLDKPTELKEFTGELDSPMGLEPKIPMGGGMGAGPLDRLGNIHARQLNQTPALQGETTGREGTTPLATVRHGMTESAIPTAAFMGGAEAGGAAGAALGALGGPAAPITVPVGALVGGLGGGMLASYAAHKAQNAALAAAPSVAKALGIDEATRRAEQEDNPYWNMAGTAIPMLLTNKFSLVENIKSVANLAKESAGMGLWGVSKETATAATNPIIGTGLMAGMDAYNQADSGKPFDWKELAIAGASGLAMGESRLFGAQPPMEFPDVRVSSEEPAPAAGGTAPEPTPTTGAPRAIAPTEGQVQPTSTPEPPRPAGPTHFSINELLDPKTFTPPEVKGEVKEGTAPPQERSPEESYLHQNINEALNSTRDRSLQQSRARAVVGRYYVGEISRLASATPGTVITAPTPNKFDPDHDEFVVHSVKPNENPNQTTVTGVWPATGEVETYSLEALAPMMRPGFKVVPPETARGEENVSLTGPDNEAAAAGAGMPVPRGEAEDQGIAGTPAGGLAAAEQGAVTTPTGAEAKQPALAPAEPSLKEGLVRLYRAEPSTKDSSKVADWVRESEGYKNTLAATDRWFTDDIEEANWYLKNEYPDSGHLTYLDVPKSDVEQFRVSNITPTGSGKNVAENPAAYSRRPEKEFFLPRHIADKRTKLSPQPAIEEDTGIPWVFRSDVTTPTGAEAKQPALAGKWTVTGDSYEGPESFTFDTEEEADRHAYMMQEGSPEDNEPGEYANVKVLPPTKAKTVPSHDQEWFSLTGADPLKAPVLNSSGQSVFPSVMGQRNFLDWFRSSQVVDKLGRPLIVYHGTGMEFTRFDRDMIERGGFGDGFHFAVGKPVAEFYANQYARGSRKVLSVYLAIENPYIVKSPEEYYRLGSNHLEIRQKLIEMGHDGVLYMHQPVVAGKLVSSENVPKEPVWVAFYPEQIKSVDNNGTFGKTPEMFESIGARRMAKDDIPHARTETERGKIKTTIAEAKEGKITPDEAVARISSILGEAKPPKAPPIREVNKFLSNLRRGVSEGTIPPKLADLVEWLVKKNPNLIEGLALTISMRGPSGQKVGRGTAGSYSPLHEIINLVPHVARDTTGVHEILHRAERMMPEDIQNDIRDLWKKMLFSHIRTAELHGTEAEQNYYNNIAEYFYGGRDPIAMKEALDAIRNGEVSADHYHMSGPSEFWAGRSEEILQDRFHASKSLLGRIKQWLKEFAEKIKHFMGLPSDAPFLRGIDAILKAKGYVTEGLLDSRAPSNRGYEYESIRRTVRNKVRPDGDKSDDIVNPTRAEVEKGEEYITQQQNAKAGPKHLPYDIYALKNLPTKENYERFVTNFQNNFRPWKNLQESLDRRGKLVMMGPKANDIWSIAAVMDSMADSYNNEFIVPAKRELASSIQAYAKDKGISPERAYETIDQILFARSANSRRDEFYRRYVPLRDTGPTKLIDGSESVWNPAAIRAQFYKRVSEIVGNQSIPRETRLKALTDIRTVLDHIVSDPANHDPLGKSFHPNRPVNDSGEPIPMSTNWGSRMYSPADFSDPHDFTEPMLRVMNNDLKKYPSLQRALDAYKGLNEATKKLKRMGGNWTEFVDDISHFYGFDDTYAPLMRDSTEAGGLDPLNLQGTRNSGDVSGITTGMTGGTHKATSALAQTVVNASRAAREASRGGLTLRVANLIKSGDVPGLGKYETTIPAKELFASAFTHTDPEKDYGAVGGNVIIHTLPNGDKEVYRIDNEKYLNSLRRPYKEPNVAVRAATRVMGGVASQFTHLRMTFAPWNMLKHTLMNSQVLSMTHGLISGPQYLALVVKNGLQGDGFNLLNVSKLFRTGQFDKLDKWAERDPFIKDAAEWLRQGGKAAYMQADDIENGGRRLLTAIKARPLMKGSDAMMMVLHQWNDSWDLLSRVTAYGLVKRDELQRLNYAAAVDAHGEGSPEATAIYNEASKRATEKAKGLANFSLYGDKGRAVSAVYMFFKPEITTKVATVDALAPLFQTEAGWLKRNLTAEEKNDPEAIDKARQEFRKNKLLAGATTVGLMGIGAAIYTLARMFSPEDEQGRNRVAIANKQGWMKAAKFPLPGTKIDLNVNFGFGPGAFVGMGAQIAAALHGDQSAKDAAVNIVDLVLEMFFPIVLSSIDPARDFFKFVIDTITPSLGKPAIEFAMNTDAFGNPIYNENTTKYPGAYTGGAGVSGMYKDAARWANTHWGVEWEPNTMKHWVSNYADVVQEYGTMAYSLTQAMRDKANMDWKPFVGSWIGRSGNTDGRDYAEVGKEVAEAKARLNVIKIDPVAGAKLRKDHPQDAALVHNFDANLGRIRKLQAAIKDTNLRDMPHKQKEAQLDMLNAQLSMEKRHAVLVAKPVGVED